MSDREYMVFIIEYDPKDGKMVNELLENIEKPIRAKHGSLQRVYQGPEKRITSAVQKILQLTE